MRLAGVAACADALTRQLAAQHTVLAGDPRACAALAESAARAARRVERLCRDLGADVPTLGERTGRAYGTLRYLEDPARLTAVVYATAEFAVAARAADAAGRSEPGFEPFVEWRFQRYLFRARRAVRSAQPGAPKRCTLALSLGFVAAPAAVLGAIWQNALGGRSPRARRAYEDYARSPAYRGVFERLESFVGPPAAPTRGRAHDLDALYADVRARFLPDATLAPPVGWSATLPTRLLGRYDPVARRITIAATLDDERVPREAVAYVLYHELLHANRPERWCGGRRVVHDAAFRAAEHRYPDAATWDAFLSRWASRQRARRRRTQAKP